MESWIEILPNSDFPLYNIPFGIFRVPGMTGKAATRIGDKVINLHGLAIQGYFRDLLVNPDFFNQDILNPFISLGKPVWRSVRERIIELFSKENPELRDRKDIHSEILFQADFAEMLLPVRVGDYTDFYSSIEHATNVGIMFRDPANALLPNWKHLPVGYHGRSSSIVVSGTDIHHSRLQYPEKGADPQSVSEPESVRLSSKKISDPGESTDKRLQRTIENIDLK
jgi:fumarylacetoacetase